MNIAIVTSWFPAGGGYVSKAYREILSNKHNVFIYARGGKNMEGDPQWDDENVTWAPKHYNDIKTSHFISWLGKKDIDVIFFNEQRFWKPVIEAKKEGYCIGAYVDYYTQETVKAFKLYDFLICNTKRHYSVFDWHDNAFYIPWGTDVEKYSPAKFERDNDKPTFIISAGWQGQYTGDRRGSLLALKAFQKVNGECKLIIYSQVKLEECLPIWQTLIKSDNRIEVKTGTYDPFPYSAGDVYLYPSRLDGIGLTLPEAISSGLAAITTDTPPMNEFVKDGYNGGLVKVEKYLGRPDGYYWPESICDLESLKNAMESYINDKSLLIQQKENARDYAKSNLDWKENAKDLPEIFSQIKKTKIDFETVKLARKLDKKMAPSITFQFLSATRMLYNYIFKK